MLTTPKNSLLTDYFQCFVSGNYSFTIQQMLFMERKHFLKNSLAFLGLAAIAPLTNACNKADVLAAGSTSGSGTTTNTASGVCTTSPVETAGPFPTKTPSSLLNSTITSDRTGVPLTINLTVNNNNNSCAALAGTIVDIWH